MLAMELDGQLDVTNPAVNITPRLGASECANTSSRQGVVHHRRQDCARASLRADLA